MARTVLDEFITIFRFEVAGTARVKAELSSIDKQVNKTISAMGRGVMMWGMAFAFVGKGVVDLEKKIIGMSTQARISTDIMWNHYHVLRKVGQQYNVTGKEMLDAFESVVELTGDADLAMRNSPLMAMMIRGGRMKAADAGSLISAFRDLKVPQEEFSELADALTHISKLGSIPIHKIGSLIPRVAGLYSATGAQGQSGMKQAITDVAAALQVGNRIMRSPKRSITAMENFINDYSDKLDEINAMTGEAFTGNEGFLPIMEALLKSFSQTGDKQGLADMFGMNKSDLKDTQNILSLADDIFGRRGIRQFAAMNLGFEDMNALIKSAEDSMGTLAADTETYWGTATGQVKQMQIALEAILLKFTEGGGMIAVFSSFAFVLGVFVDMLNMLPDGFVTAIMLSLLWYKVILGLLVTAFKPLIMFIVTSAGPVMTYWNGLMLRGRTGMSLFTISISKLKLEFLKLNNVMRANVILQVIGLVVQLIFLLGIAFNGLKSLFGGGKNELRMDGVNLDGMRSPLSVAPVSRPTGASGGGNINNISFNAEFGDNADPIAVRENMRLGVEDAMVGINATIVDAFPVAG